jgi:hypothetical protein
MGGDAKATTQTARVVRKLAEKTAKRNKVTVQVTPHTEGGDLTHDFIIKKGGKVKAVGDMGYDALAGDKNTRGLGLIEIKSIGTPEAHGGVNYDWDAHAKHAGKTLKPSDVKTAIKELGKKFPSARKVSGFRDTGAKGGTGKKQTINMPEPATATTRLEKAVRRNSARLSGAMKGVEMLPSKLGKSLARGPAGLVTAPLEAGFTAYATGGGATGAVTAAAATTGVGAGITTALKKAGTAAVKHAPGLARVAGKAAVPVAVAAAGYDLFRIANEGYKAHEAASNARTNEKYMSDNYGSIEAATRTRRQRTGGR